MIADENCLKVNKPSCDGDSPKNALCGYLPEEFAEVGLLLLNKGAALCKKLNSNLAMLFLSFAGLLSAFDRRICDLFNESLACESVELLSEWEAEYGLPSACMTNYPKDIPSRQAMVCAARKALGVQTLAQLEAILQIALDCPFLTLTQNLIHSTFGGWTGGTGQPLTQSDGICVNNIGPALLPAVIHNTVGGWGVVNGIGGSTAPYGSGFGQPLTLNDPNFVQQDVCPIIYHSTFGGWTGGMGQPLTVYDPQKWQLLTCLMQKYLPAHIKWQACS